MHTVGQRLTSRMSISGIFKTLNEDSRLTFDLGSSVSKSGSLR